MTIASCDSNQAQIHHQNQLTVWVLNLVLRGIVIRKDGDDPSVSGGARLVEPRPDFGHAPNSDKICIRTKSAQRRTIDTGVLERIAKKRPV